MDPPAPSPSDSPRPLDVATLAAATHDLALGHPLLYFPEIGSTNTHAHDLARRGTAEGTLVVTDHQTAGRGRIGRTWQSLPGQQLTLSLVLYPRFPPHFLVMASALAVAEAIAATTPLQPGIKWPNDILLDGRKLCGILIETSADFAILGLGLNVNGTLTHPPDVAARATTLARALGHEVSREALAAELLRRLDGYYTTLQTGATDAQATLRDAWRDRLVMLGQQVMLRQGGQALAGIAEDVDAGGALLLRTPDGLLHVVTWGDVE
ncbi:MAG: biotin--[acetyl-CoA-carboxylase] ligase [Ktedonobacterales bacterium]|nr:biotin--[acetyl-CoA-carboxylase] ligase [Ktedonobacterales bacterium]